jgi:hypothetical protein
MKKLLVGPTVAGLLVFASYLHAGAADITRDEAARIIRNAINGPEDKPEANLPLRSVVGAFRLSRTPAQDELSDTKQALAGRSVLQKRRTQRRPRGHAQDRVRSWYRLRRCSSRTILLIASTLFHYAPSPTVAARLFRLRASSAFS